MAYVKLFYYQKVIIIVIHCTLLRTPLHSFLRDTDVLLQADAGGVRTACGEIMHVTLLLWHRRKMCVRGPDQRDSDPLIKLLNDFNNAQLWERDGSDSKNKCATSKIILVFRMNDFSFLNMIWIFASLLVKYIQAVAKLLKLLSMCAFLNAIYFIQNVPKVMV